MIKVMTIVGTRPELIKMSRVISEFDRYTNHILVHTGQNYDYELNQIFFDQLGIRKPDYFLNVASESVSAAQTIGRVIEKSDEVFRVEKPDALLLYGDTNSCLSVISAKKNKIPIFHMEAGNRCFDQRVPEEINRKVVDHLSDINLVLTEHARRYLLAEGISPDRIIKTGSHMREVLNYYSDAIAGSDILNDLGLHPGKYFLMSLHREENVDSDKNILEFYESIQAIAVKYAMPIIISTHPRTRSRLEKVGVNSTDHRIKFLKPFGFFEYVKLQTSAYCVLSDSGTITEEASMLRFPAVNLRGAHERPEGMDGGVLIMSPLKVDSILQALDVTLDQVIRGIQGGDAVNDYDSENVSQKVLKTVISYIDFINRVVWHKP
jgi:UDP-N-acetylglucosamine 2-epimerase (non-hydrolysing)